ncbi:MAG: mechanosensitive ion channel family protein, partial [Mesorhizobium sp.]
MGFGAEWLFRRAIGGVKQSATAAEREERGAVNWLSELAPLVVFTLVSAGVFLAFEWPALLRLAVMTYLVAFIVVRAVMALARILLAPTAGAVSAEQGTPLRLIQASDAEAHFW